MKKQKDQSVCSERARLMQSGEKCEARAGPALPGAEPQQSPCRAQSGRSSRRPGLEEGACCSGSGPALGACLFLGPG